MSTHSLSGTTSAFSTSIAIAKRQLQTRLRQSLSPGSRPAGVVTSSLRWAHRAVARPQLTGLAEYECRPRTLQGSRIEAQDWPQGRLLREPLLFSSDVDHRRPLTVTAMTAPNKARYRTPDRSAHR